MRFLLDFSNGGVPPSSPTKEEQSVRVRKKVKIREDRLVEDWVEEGEVMVDVEESQVTSTYKEVLMEVLGSDNDVEEDWGDCLDDDLLENRWYKQDPGEAKESKPKFMLGVEIPISDEELTLWSKSWKNALIFKVLGKHVSFRLLENELCSYWVKKGR